MRIPHREGPSNAAAMCAFFAVLGACASGVGGSRSADAGPSIADLGGTAVDLPDGGTIVVASGDAGISRAPDAAPVLPPGTYTGPLEGIWRQVHYVFPFEGRSLDLTDTNQPVQHGPTTVDLRAHGLLVLRANRFAMTFVALYNDHGFVRSDTTDVWNGLTTFGGSTPGTLVRDAVIPAGGGAPIQLLRNADGTISLPENTSTGAGLRIYARTDGLSAGPSRYTARGRAGWLGNAPHAPFRGRARFAIAWDEPGSAGGHRFAHDAAIGFTPFDQGEYDVSVLAPPESAVATLGTVHAAVGFLVAYDDVDADGRFTQGTDRLRGGSPMALAWRDGPLVDPTLENTPFRDVPPGFTIVHIQPDPGLARLVVVPYETNTQMPPDLALDGTGTADLVLPDLLH